MRKCQKCVDVEGKKMAKCFGKEYGVKPECEECDTAYQCWIKDEKHGAIAEEAGKEK